jgi:hypothetical protein
LSSNSSPTRKLSTLSRPIATAQTSLSLRTATAPPHARTQTAVLRPRVL